MARLPIEEKIACLVEIQKMVRGIKHNYPVWAIGRDIAGRGLARRRGAG